MARLHRRLQSQDVGFAECHLAVQRLGIAARHSKRLCRDVERLDLRKRQPARKAQCYAPRPRCHVKHAKVLLSTVSVDNHINELLGLHPRN